MNKLLDKLSGLVWLSGNVLVWSEEIAGSNWDTVSCAQARNEHKRGLIHPFFKIHGQSNLKSETEGARGPTKWWQVTAKKEGKKRSGLCALFTLATPPSMEGNPHHGGNPWKGNPWDSTTRPHSGYHIIRESLVSEICNLSAASSFKGIHQWYLLFQASKSETFPRIRTDFAVTSEDISVPSYEPIEWKYHSADEEIAWVVNVWWRSGTSGSLLVSVQTSMWSTRAFWKKGPMN